MKPLTIALLTAALGLAGCATPGAYDWGQYDELLYRSYKDVTCTEAMRVGLEQHVTALESRDQKVAPGLYAELGTLYLQAGDMTRAIALYEKERASWPESEGLMSAMITNLERRRPADDSAESVDTAQSAENAEIDP